MSGLPGAAAVAARAAACGVALPPGAAEAVAAHAAAVLAANDLLHLTTVAPGDFLERHIGEALEGIALLPVGAGTCVDLGSGNGYPGVPLALAGGLDLVMAESKRKKADFLRSLGLGRVLEVAVRSAADLAPAGPAAVLACRAMEGWERVLPRLGPALAPGGCLLLWAGEDLPRFLRRAAWSGWRLAGTRDLPGRDRSRIWKLELNS